MSTSNPSSQIDLLLRILGTANALTPTIAQVAALIKSGRKSGKTDAEIEAQANESMETALRTRDKAKQQMGDQP